MSSAALITLRFATRVASCEVPLASSLPCRAFNAAVSAGGSTSCNRAASVSMRGRNSATYAAMSSFSYPLRSSYAMARSSRRPTSISISTCTRAGRTLSCASISDQSERRSNDSRMMVKARATSATDLPVSSVICQT